MQFEYHLAETWIVGEEDMMKWRVFDLHVLTQKKDLIVVSAQAIVPNQQSGMALQLGDQSFERQCFVDDSLLPLALNNDPSVEQIPGQWLTRKMKSPNGVQNIFAAIRRKHRQGSSEKLRFLATISLRGNININLTAAWKYIEQPLFSNE
jgi:hypothetical protein